MTLKEVAKLEEDNMLQRMEVILFIFREKKSKKKKMLLIPIVTKKKLMIDKKKKQEIGMIGKMKTKKVQVIGVIVDFIINHILL